MRLIGVQKHNIYLFFATRLINWISFICRYIFTIVSYLIGVFIFATIVGQVGNVITNRNANRLEFERLLDGAKTYMRHHKVRANIIEFRILKLIGHIICVGTWWYETACTALV